jgi:hypothetical protein
MILMPNKANMINTNQEWTLMDLMVLTVITVMDHMVITVMVPMVTMDHMDIMVLMMWKKEDMVQHKAMYRKEELNQDMDHNLVMTNKVMVSNHNLGMDNKDMDNNHHNLGMDNNLHNNIQEVIKVIGKYYINY